MRELSSLKIITPISWDSNDCFEILFCKFHSPQHANVMGSFGFGWWTQSVESQADCCHNSSPIMKWHARQQQFSNSSALSFRFIHTILWLGDNCMFICKSVLNYALHFIPPLYSLWQNYLPYYVDMYMNTDRPITVHIWLLFQSKLQIFCGETPCT